MSLNRIWKGGLGRKGLQWATGALGLLPIGLAVFSVPVFAQIVPDNTLGSESSQVTPNVNIRGLPAERIDGGAVRGSALFHSFFEFNVNNGQRVFFSNPAGIADIFSRVTGNNISNILGTLGVDGGANLFVLNPNGILFGPNAQLDIQGSFLATAGSSFKFSDGSEFSATQPQAAPLLSINVTPGVQWGANQPGATITNRGNLKAGQDLTLAGGNLDVQGQLQAGQDLILQAQDTLTVRDTVSSPFIATSGRHLTMQGNQNVDIFALNHPLSQLQSGGNFNLISDGNISGDAHFFSGGNLSMLTLSGTPGNFVSLFDPIIRAQGDVQFGNYTGVALKVEATGSIQGGNIRITGSDNTNTIPANDPDYATLTQKPSVILRAGLDSVSTTNLPQNAGGTSFTGASGLPLGITVGNIDTSRSDGGNGGDIILSAAKGNIATGNLDSGSYSSSGNSGNGGAITLSTTNGNISTGSLDSRSYSRSYLNPGKSGNGGEITLSTTNGNISTGSLYSISYTRSDSDKDAGDSGHGGAITLSTTNGIISTATLSSRSQSYSKSSGNGGTITLSTTNGIISTDSVYSTSSSGSGKSGNGGAITLSTTDSNISLSGLFDSASNSVSGNSGNGGAITVSTTKGNISLWGWLSSSSYSTSGNSGNGGAITLSTSNGNISLMGSLDSYSYSAAGNSEDGGAITVSTTSGNISLKRDLNSFSYSKSGNSGTGGTIFLNARDGDILGERSLLNSFSVSEKGTAGNGGKVTLEAQNNVSNLDILTLSSYASAKAGDVEVKGFGDFSLTDTNILTSGQLKLKIQGQEITLDVGKAGQSGDVTVNSLGNLTFNNSRIESDTKGSASAGDVTITSPGLVTFNNSQIISNTNSTGQAGSITVSAPEIRLDSSSRLSAKTSSSGRAGDVNLQPYTGGQTLSVFFQDKAEISASSTSSGQGGNILVKAPQSVTLSGNGTLTAETSGSNRAGNVEITTPTLNVNGGAKVSTTTTSTVNTGTGGDITVKANTLNLSGANSGLLAETRGAANAGNLTLNPYSGNDLQVNFAEGAKVSASTFGSGQGGSLNVTSPNSVTLRGNGQLSAEATNGGNAGGVTINTQQLSIEQGAQVAASSKNGFGTAGDVDITASTVTLNNGKVTAETDAGGSANPANITLRNVNTLNLSNNSSISASTQKGQAGSINLNQGANPTALVTLNNSRISAQADGERGNAGGVTLNTSRLSLEDSAKISASNISGTSQDITLQGLNTLQLSNNSEISASTGSGKGGSVSVNAQGGTVALTGDSHIQSEANGGQAGNLDITANQVTLRDRSSATVSSTGRGTAGKLAVSAPEVILEYSAKLAATTQAGSGGDIQLQNLSSLQLSNGSEISASTQSGTGGNVSVNAPGGTITLTGDSSLKAEATQGGQAGNLQITANQLTLRDGSQATVSSPQGQAGNLSVTANNLLLDEGGITAETGKRSEQGGANINLQLTDLLLLRHQSLISANATGDANGGNITIKAPFVVAVPYENSDIIANAFSGDGGQINIINNYRVFGLKPQSRQSFDTLRQNRTSDISASSQSGNQGNINIQSLSIDPSQGLTQLPVEVIDSSQQIANRCGAGNSKSANAQGEFVVTGRGGLPPSPDDMQRSGAIAPSWVTRDGGNSRRLAAPVEPPATPSTRPLVEAQGMFINAKGEIVLTAQTPTTTPHQPGIAEPLCSPATNGNE